MSTPTNIDKTTIHEYFQNYLNELNRPIQFIEDLKIDERRNINQIFEALASLNQNHTQNSHFKLKDRDIATKDLNADDLGVFLKFTDKILKKHSQIFEDIEYKNIIDSARYISKNFNTLEPEAKNLEIEVIQSELKTCDIKQSGEISKQNELQTEFKKWKSDKNKLFAKSVLSLAVSVSALVGLLFTLPIGLFIFLPILITGMVFTGNFSRQYIPEPKLDKLTKESEESLQKMIQKQKQFQETNIISDRKFAEFLKNKEVDLNGLMKDNPDDFYTKILKLYNDYKNGIINSSHQKQL